MAKCLGLGTLGLAALAAVLLLAGLSQSEVELTPNGVHSRLLFPAGASKDAAIQLWGGTGDKPVLPGFLDGPVVRNEADGTWSAAWFCEDRVERSSGAGAELHISCGGKQSRYPVSAPPSVPPSVIPMPAQLLVLSDVEGNLAFLDAALQKLGVADADGNWRYGRGQLVIAGDAVDRGRDVFGVLWRIYGLSLQAAQVGGAVHMVLGNHEQYLLRGNVSRANREHLYALEQLGGQRAAFAADTVLGNWLRAQPVVVQAGKVLLTHGGISREVAASGLSVEQLNEAMRRYWRGEPASKAELDAVLGADGVSRYRGYFDAGDKKESRASQEDIEAALRHFGADAIVVGHTQVERVSSLYQGRVHAVDVNSNGAAPEVLLFENGVPRVVDMGVGRALPEGAPAAALRPFKLTAAADWQALGRNVQAAWRLSRLPHPY
ncbi:metallophosphoesterase [Massilia sp. Root351]|uniref:metallophosphoesterase n=1 Tax=Massilia sp. Root351 TaxID=1736522 RepID=UPI00138F0AB7|nr:metallophosphoesterase [Massilia sp. Root351]